MNLYKSLQGVGLAAFAATLGVLGVAVAGWLSFDSNVRGSWGLPPFLADYMWASYGPSLLAMGLGYRDFVLNTFVAERRRKTQHRPLQHGAGVLYAFIVVGAVIAVGGILWVARGMDEERAKRVIMACSVVWAASNGYIYSRFFKDNAESGAAEQPPGANRGAAGSSVE